MAQNISIEIAGKRYPLSAQNEDMEEIMRKSAKKVNRTFEDYAGKFPHYEREDILAVVALNATVNASLRDIELQKSNLQARQISEQLSDYLQGK